MLRILRLSLGSGLGWFERWPHGRVSPRRAQPSSPGSPEAVGLGFERPGGA